MKRAFTYLLFSWRILTLFYGAIWAIGTTSFAIAFTKKVAQKEAISNFAFYEAEIMYFSNLFLSKKPAKHEVSFSLNGNEGALSIGMSSRTVNQSFSTHHFNFKVSSVNEETAFLKELGWDIQTFRNIVAAFRKTNCKSLKTNEEEILIWFKSGTWSSYGYQVISNPLNDGTRKKYEDSGTQYLNKRVSLKIASAF